MTRDFLLIHIADNDFSQRVYEACNMLVPIFEDAKDDIGKISDEYIIKFLASTVARLSALETDYYNKIYNTTSDEAYEAYFDRIQGYLISNISIVHSFDDIISELSEMAYRKSAIEDIGLSDTEQLKFYLRTNTDNFALLPYLYWCNQERILMRICFDNSQYKSQIKLI